MIRELECYQLEIKLEIFNILVKNLRDDDDIFKLAVQKKM